jgi:hypothetical protein
MCDFVACLIVAIAHICLVYSPLPNTLTLLLSSQSYPWPASASISTLSLAPMKVVLTLCSTEPL